jgi:S-adenosylmethionine:tRNA ribosyltransferase-isomerase
VLDLALARAQEAVDAVRHRRRRGVRQLETLQPRVDPPPARADEIDEQREVVHPGMALRKQIALDPFQAFDRLGEQTADLRDVPSDGEHLEADALANGGAHVLGNRRFEFRSGDRERLELVTGTFEGRFQIGGREPARCCVGDASLRALECVSVHGRRGYPHRRMDTAELEYELPQDLVAQQPAEPRDSARLLVYRLSTGEIEHHVFSDLPDLLAGELPVVNDTRVVPARLRLRRTSGGAAEVLLVEPVGSSTWEALVRPSNRLRAHERLGPVELLEPLGEGRWLVQLDGAPEGEAPLPPYITEPLADPSRYQTVFARELGSAAAPTAGLHFTPELVQRLDPVRVTLHVGLDTFRPVAADRLEEHVLHGERYSVTRDAWRRIAGAARVLAVGTTTVRVLETIARTGELAGRSSLFVTPGFEFRRVDALLTNFHLPRSTLLALVMAFLGAEETRRLYRVAIEERYRFYSFGDAMVAL